MSGMRISVKAPYGVIASEDLSALRQVPALRGFAPKDRFPRQAIAQDKKLDNISCTVDEGPGFCEVSYGRETMNNEQISNKHVGNLMDVRPPLSLMFM